jgi:hypothetical protein
MLNWNGKYEKIVWGTALRLIGSMLSGYNLKESPLFPVQLRSSVSKTHLNEKESA